MIHREIGRNERGTYEIAWGARDRHGKEGSGGLTGDVRESASSRNE